MAGRGPTRRNTRFVSLISAVVLLFSGAATAAQEGDRDIGSMMMAAALVLLGVWVALEVLHEMGRDGDDNDNDD